ncbi:MAG TPA: hypothetical protein VMV09_08175 [Candidatus Saccharimonadales bacterium]|nr:hypothetical protein [Candidatus Saccharimonadales bacterium]
MIEVKSWPSDLVGWSEQPPGERTPFYLGFLGETEPLLDQSVAVVVPAKKGAPSQEQSAPVYEYWWTIGHGGVQLRTAWWRRLIGVTGPTRSAEPWEDLDAVAARGYLYFPISGGWRVKEQAASVNYLSPVREPNAWLGQIGKGLQAVQPVVGDAGTVAGLVPGGATASKWMEAVAQLKISSVPQTGKFNWSVGKVTFGSATHGPMQGVVWQLPRSLFQLVGGRLTGSLAVSFIRVPVHGAPTAPPKPMKALAHAVLYHKGGTYSWMPATPTGEGFVEFDISPRLATAGTDAKPVNGVHHGG